MFSLISLLTESWLTAAYKPIAKSRIEWLIEIVTSKGTFVIKSMKIANMFTVRIQRLDLKVVSIIKVLECESQTVIKLSFWIKMKIIEFKVGWL